MEQNKVTAIIMQYKDLIPSEQVYMLREALEKADDGVYDRLTTVGTKSPIMTLLLSIFLGGFGVDRFYLGDIGLGIAKLAVVFVTFGLAFVWPLVDIFFCYKKAKKVNFDNLMRAIKF